MRRVGADAGFTLVEVIVSMALAMIVLGATLSSLEVFQRTSNYDLKRNEASDTARNAIDRLARDLRNTSAPSTGFAGALEVAEPYNVVFQTIDSKSIPAGSKNKTNAMLVRYCLNDSTPTNEVLWLQVKRWETETAPTTPSSTTCPDATAGDWESSSRLASFITNRNGGQSRALFNYGPSGASEVSKITLVEPSIYVDVNPGHLPGETHLASAVTLRNANRKPIATMKVTEKGADVFELNASESEDPDGLALTYKWTEGSTVLSTSQTYETVKEKSGTSYTFKLEVTDPGGLTSSTSKTVTAK